MLGCDDLQPFGINYQAEAIVRSARSREHRRLEDRPGSQRADGPRSAIGDVNCGTIWRRCSSKVRMCRSLIVAQFALICPAAHIARGAKRSKAEHARRWSGPAAKGNFQFQLGRKREIPRGPPSSHDRGDPPSNPNSVGAASPTGEESAERSVAVGGPRTVIEGDIGGQKGVTERRRPWRQDRACSPGTYSPIDGNSEGTIDVRAIERSASVLRAGKYVGAEKNGR
ncbi:hypothetical protein KM043_004133 [Ampulex compressa]|nr:hypothetical protein KM043_004133 [Ampulex compressa]